MLSGGVNAQYRPACASSRAAFSGVQLTQQAARRGKLVKPRADASTRVELRPAGPLEAAPDYQQVDEALLNRLILSRFRSRMVAALGQDVTSTGYQSIVDLTRILNAKFNCPEGTQRMTRQILVSLFPKWLLPAFKVMFSKPLPQLSCRLNAFVTAVTCQWLMGKCSVNDAEDGDGNLLPGQGVHVERCRYLEETQCASICLNSCKLPTQEFFAKDMGLQLLMEPNYDDFSCQFSFGRQPPAVDEALTTPCFVNCPTKQRHHLSASLCQGGDPVHLKHAP